MLDRFGQLAQRLYPFAPALFRLSLISLLLFFGLLFGAGADLQARWLLPSLLAFLWLLSGWAFVVSFAAVPAAQHPPTTATGRWIYSLKRLWYWLLAICFLLTTTAVLLFSIRLLRVGQ